jgi:AcrR family transcriptional regulator
MPGQTKAKPAKKGKTKAVLKARAKSYHHGSLRDELLAAAIAAIEERGFVEFNLRELAKTCGVSAAAVYRHFSSKNQLLVELAAQGFTKMGLEFDAIMSEAGTTAATKLDRLGVKYVQFAMENEGLFRVMFSRELCGFEEYKAIEPMAERTFRALQNALGALGLERGSRAGGGKRARAEARAGEVQVFASWALVHGLAYLWIDRNLELSEKSFRHLLTEIFGQAQE